VRSRPVGRVAAGSVRERAEVGRTRGPGLPPPSPTPSCNDHAGLVVVRDPQAPPSTDRRRAARMPGSAGHAVPVIASLSPSLVIAFWLIGATPMPAGPGWQWPLEPRPPVMRPFVPPPGPFAAGHRGVDLLGVDGEPVYAAGGGVVAFAGLVAGRGVIVVSHGELRTTYEPVSPEVTSGDAVAPGAVLGRLELTGGHCLPLACLHWGVRRTGDYLDPLRLVVPVRPRLLPLWRGVVGPGRVGEPPPSTAPAPSRPRLPLSPSPAPPRTRSPAPSAAPSSAARTIRSPQVAGTAIVGGAGAAVVAVLAVRATGAAAVPQVGRRRPERPRG
jgi:hypothetical protein